MAHFRATIQGTRGEASRLGSEKGGMVTVLNGWNAGVKVVARRGNDRDVFDIYWTGGSNRNTSQFLGTVMAEQDKHFRDTADGSFVPEVKGYKGGKP